MVGQSPLFPPKTIPLPWPPKLGGNTPKTRPYYRWLESRIQYLIDSRTWQAGERIPNEMDIANATGLNVHTVKKALLNLVEKGYLVRIKKRGTFVTDHNENASRYRFYTLNDVLDHNRTALHSACEGLENIRLWDESIFRKFGCGPEQYKITRRIFVEDKPVLYTISWLDASLHPDFEHIDLERFIHESLYSIMDSEYNIIIHHSQEQLSAIEAPEHIAPFLNVEPGSPILFSLLLNYTDNKVVCECRKSYLDTRCFTLQRAW